MSRLFTLYCTATKQLQINKIKINTTVPIQNNYSSRMVDLNQYTTNYEVTNLPEDWKYVERALSTTIIPLPSEKQEYPSGWMPQKAKPDDLPYFVERTKHFMLPVYLDLSHRNSRKLTTVRKIQGDIWYLEDELRNYLTIINNKKIVSQINEVSGRISFRGDFVNQIKDFLIEKKL